MKIGIVVPVLNNFKGLAECLASVRTKYEWQPYVVPNWQRGLSVAASWNEYAAYAFKDGADLVLISGDDVVFSDHTIDALVELISRPQDGKEIILSTGVNVREKSIDGSSVDSTRQEDIASWPTPKETVIEESPDFSCFMITPRTFELVGTFDENFHPAYYEDNDYHRRISLLGYGAVSTTKAPFYHERSTTMKAIYESLPDDYKAGIKEVNAKNKQYYVRKWGGMPGEETFATPYDDEALNPSEWTPGLNKRAWISSNEG